MATDAVNLLFPFLEPRLDFHDPERQLLIAALQGATDQELSNELIKHAARRVMADHSNTRFRHSGGAIHL